ncbi:MAG: hypothetical protein ACXAEU_25635 [Candidatus Hodarchaeales archaeon]
MSFASQVLGIITFRRNMLIEIAESEDLTIRGWFLLILSSIIAGLCISMYILSETGITPFNLIVGLSIPILFCFFYGFDLAWSVVAIKKGYSTRSFLTLDGLKGLKDPDFQRSIRLMGYSSLVLLFSGIILFTGIKFYQMDMLFFPFNLIPIFDPFFVILSPLFFPYIMFLNPLEHPIVFFFAWQTIIFIYGYNISTEEEKNKNLLGLILGFIIFTFFWIIVFIAAILTVIAIGGMLSGGGSCDCSCAGCGSGKKNSKNKSSSKQQMTIITRD